MRALIIAAALLALPCTAQGKSLDCVLWPRSAACQPAPPAPVPASPVPPVRSPVVAPKAPSPAPTVDTGRPMPKGPVVAKAKPKPKPKAAKSKRVKPTAKRVADDGPDLPWPCWQVKLGALGKSEAQLKAEGTARGIKLTPKQERQAKACLGKT